MARENPYTEKLREDAWKVRSNRYGDIATMGAPDTEYIVARLVSPEEPADPQPESGEASWRPIETAPWEGHGKPVLLYRDGEYFAAMRLRGAHGPGWCTPDGFQIFRPTHWMPLPDPPETRTEGEG